MDKEAKKNNKKYNLYKQYHKITKLSDEKQKKFDQFMRNISAERSFN
jgi:DNA phosphorothioation-dependent restriction protein DptG